METPKNQAGVLTEAIMARVDEKERKLTTWQRNGVYEAVYEILAANTYDKKPMSREEFLESIGL